MIDYEGRNDTLTAFPETVPVSVLEYRTLVEYAEKGRVLCDAMLNCMRLESVSGHETQMLDSLDLIAVFRAVYPDDYEVWMENKRRKLAEEREASCDTEQ